MIETTNPADLQSSEDKSGEFYKLPFYLELNERFVRLLPIVPGQNVLDLACGTGTNTQLIAEKVGESGRVFAVDILERVLAEAKVRLANLKTPVEFIQGKAEELSSFLREVVGQVDAVIIGNAIHNFEDKRKVIDEVGVVLKLGGPLAFNLTFFKGGVPKDEEPFYKRWMSRALRIAAVKMREEGLERQKKEEDEEKVQARQPISPLQYARLLRRAGFRLNSLRTVRVAMPPEAFIKIAQDPDFLEGSMPRFPQDVATSSLQQAAGEVFREMSKTFSTRNWLEVVAVKVS